MTEVSEETLRLTAEIMGGSSAAAQALAEARRFQLSGCGVRFFKEGKSILVCAQPPEPTVAPDQAEKEE